MTRDPTDPDTRFAMTNDDAPLSQGASIPEERSADAQSFTSAGSKPHLSVWRIVPWLAAAAGIAAAITIGVLSTGDLDKKERELSSSRAALQDAQDRLTQVQKQAETDQKAIAAAHNDTLALAAAQRNAETLANDLRERDDRLTQIHQQNQELSRLLDEARLAIARYKAPADPATLQQDRRKLLSIPGSIRVAWTPYEVPNAVPPEQPAVQGDVIWNDAIKSGYLRFVGLKVNDPKVEQYQVWVIDERGLEQKVSGGVFNAAAEGEVIVPIQPGIDVGRVALFAVTIEKPGGTWVPDLKRRIVIAPRGEG